MPLEITSMTPAPTAPPGSSLQITSVRKPGADDLEWMSRQGLPVPEDVWRAAYKKHVEEPFGRTAERMLGAIGDTAAALGRTLTLAPLVQRVQKGAEEGEDAWTRAARLGAGWSEGAFTAPRSLLSIGPALTGPLDYLREQVAPESEGAYRVWRYKKQKELEAVKNQDRLVSPEWVRGGFKPYSEMGELSGLLYDPLNYIPVAASAVGKRFLRGAEVGGEVAARAAASAEQASAIQRGIQATGREVSAVGRGVKAVAGIPAKIGEAVVEGTVGKEAAERLGEVASLAGVKVPTVATAAGMVAGPAAAAAVAAPKTAKLIGGAAETLGTALEEAGAADRFSPLGRLWEVAHSPTAPQWLKQIAGATPTKILAAGAKGATELAKGAGVGGAVGGFLAAGEAAEPEQVGAGIGSGATFGGLVRVAAHPAIRNAQLIEKNMVQGRRFLQQQLAAGVAPETLAKVPDNTFITAAILQKIFGDADVQNDRGIRIAILTGEQSAKVAGKPVAGWWQRLPTTLKDGTQVPGRTLFLNADNPGRPIDVTILHELMHPLFEGEVANRPELKTLIDSELAKRGLSAEDAKEAYARKLLGPQWAEARKQFPAMFDAAVKEWVTKSDQHSANTYGDANQWVYGELMSEAAIKALYGKNIVLDVLSPGVLGRSLEAARTMFEQLGVKFKQGEKPGTVLPDFDEALDSPELRKATYALLRKQKEFIQGVSEAEPQTIKITPEMQGKAPWANVYDLGDGRIGNDFGYLDQSGKWNRFPPSKTRRIFATRAAEVKAAIPDTGTPEPADTANPNVVLRVTPGGTVMRWGYKLADQIRGMASFSPRTKALVEMVDQAIAAGKAFRGWYQQVSATGAENWAASVRHTLGTVEAQFKEWVPLAYRADKQSNLLVDVYDLSAFRRKAADWANRTGPVSLELWGGNIERFAQDVATYNRNHATGQPGETGIGTSKRDVINAFLIGANKSFQGLNPMRTLLSGTDKKGIIRSYRLDRIETADPMEAVFGRPDYGRQVRNLSPQGEPFTPRTVKITGPDGKEYEGRLDGWQDMRVVPSVGKFVPQITLEKVPGFPEKTTTYGPSLEKKGFKVEIPAEARPEGMASPQGEIDISKELARLRQDFAGSRAFGNSGDEAAWRMMVDNDYNLYQAALREGFNPDEQTLSGYLGDRIGQFQPRKQGEPFEPLTKKGQALTKNGFELRLEDYGGTAWRFFLYDDAGKDIAYAEAHATPTAGKGTATISQVWVDEAYRRAGIAEALVRETATQMQQAGLKTVSGHVVHPGTERIRYKVFGKPLVVEDAGVYTRPEAMAEPFVSKHMVSKIDPNAVYSPEGERTVNKPQGEHDRMEYVVGTVQGDHISIPEVSYQRAKDTGTNPWIRRGADPALDAGHDNSDRLVMMQFSSDLLYKGSAQDPVAGAYYDKLYSGARPGYARMEDFWEIPQWQGFLAHVFPKADVYVVRDLAQAKQFLKDAGYGRVAFSSLDVNKNLIRELATDYGKPVDVGGYTEPGFYDDIPNIKWHDTVESLARDAGVEYKNGVDYRHYAGSDVIPRLTMSQGCRHKCAFCSVPKAVTETPMAVVEQQADAIAKLGSKLVYLNDKTFGQASNYKELSKIYQRIRAQNPDFKGFVIQTTAAQLKIMPAEWLKESGIKFVELGVESYNDPILKEMHKPANTKLINEVTQKLRDARIALIPNIIIGYPGETEATYANTLNWLKANEDIISHANIYNLALYKDAELGKKLISISEDDFNENVLEKSFHADPKIHQQFAGDLYGLASDMLSSAPEMAEFSPEGEPVILKKAPKETVKGYKLFRTLKTRPGEIFPLFIGATKPTPIGKWIEAENLPTKGFSPRPGWHIGLTPEAPHLMTKEGKMQPGRVWAEVEIPADVDWQTQADQSPTKDIRGMIPKGGHYVFPRPGQQGGEWLVAGALKVNKVLSRAEAEKLGVQYSPEGEASPSGAPKSPAGSPEGDRSAQDGIPRLRDASTLWLSPGEAIGEAATAIGAVDAQEAAQRAFEDAGRAYAPTAAEWEARKAKLKEEKPRASGKLPYTRGGKITAYQFSSTGGLTEADPAKMGRGRATTADLRGINKSFFFVKGSGYGQDKGLFDSKYVYQVDLDGAKIYDATKSDPLGYYGMNREQAEQGLKDRGYQGVYVETPDGRKVVATFVKLPMRLLGWSATMGGRATGRVSKAAPEPIGAASPQGEAMPVQRPEPTKEEATFEKGLRVEAHDHPVVAAEHPELLPQLVHDELKLDKNAYAKDADPGGAPTGAAFSPQGKAPDEKALTRYAKRVTSATFGPDDKGTGATFNVAMARMLRAGKDETYPTSLFPDLTVKVPINPDDIPGTKAAVETAIKDYIKNNFELLADKRLSLGTWVNDGKVWLDVSMTHPDRAFSEYAARRYNQAAIYDLKNQQEIPTGGTGEPIPNPPAPKSRLNLLEEEWNIQKPKLGQEEMFEGPKTGGLEMKNVRDLQLVQPARELTTTERVASELGAETLKERVQLLPETEDKVLVERALERGFPEVVQALKEQMRNKDWDSGKDWYRKDILKMEDVTKRIFPETEDPQKMNMFKVLLAAFSGGATPGENYQFASEAFAQYLKTGKVPATTPFRVSPEGTPRFLGRSAEMTADKLNGLIEQLGGEKQFIDYLFTHHEKTLLDNLDCLGALDLGPKFGRFFLNLTGHENEVTVDLWATRTYNRWMGTPFRRIVKKGAETKFEMRDVPTDKERNVIIEAFRRTADMVSETMKIRIDAMDVQALLWFYEKDLYASRGARVDRGNFSSAAEVYEKAPLHKLETPRVTGEKKMKASPGQEELIQ